MKPRSVYIVKSKIISLSNCPFAVIKNLRPAFSKIFENENCFSDLKQAVADYYRFNPLNGNSKKSDNTHRSREIKNPITKAPFIKSLGQVNFNTRSLLFTEYAYEKPRFLKSLTKHNRYWSDKAKPLISDNYSDVTFGYNKSLKDQRMNFLSFELGSPVKLTAYSENQKVADGKIFVHFYPSGYIVINVAVSLKIVSDYNISQIKEIAQRDIITTYKSKWTWFRNKQKTTLYESVHYILERVYASLFEDEPYEKNSLRNWFTTLSIASDCSKKQIIEHFGLNDNMVFSFSKTNGKQSLIVSRKKALFLSETCFSRKKILSSFWKIMLINEFVILKTEIYNALISYFKEEVLKLKEARLTEFKSRKKIKYDSKIPNYLLALDYFINQVPSKFRAVYSVISTQYQFSKLHKQLRRIINTWEKELDKIHCDNKVINKYLVTVLGNLSLIDNLSVNFKNYGTMKNEFIDNVFNQAKFIDNSGKESSQSKPELSEKEIEILKLINEHAKSEDEKIELMKTFRSHISNTNESYG